MKIVITLMAFIANATSSIPAFAEQTLALQAGSVVRIEVGLPTLVSCSGAGSTTPTTPVYLKACT